MDKRKLRFFYIYSADLRYGKSQVESMPAAPAVQLHALTAHVVQLHALAALPAPAEQYHGDVGPAQVSQLGQDNNCACDLSFIVTLLVVW